MVSTQTPGPRPPASAPPPGPWYRGVSGAQWKAFFATFLGWLLDAFDFTILTFILLDIQQSFTVDRALAGALGTVTLMFRLVGGLGAGMVADRRGRKLPLMLSILWFSLFALLSGFSTSYAMLFAFRALFGIGMGGVWAAGMPLALEHWPTHLRGLASGLLQGGWYWGYLLSALTFHYVYPLFSRFPDPFSDVAGSTLGWRVLFGLGALPALLVLWIRSGVSESPVWLARQRHLRQAAQGTEKPDPSHPEAQELYSGYLSLGGIMGPCDPHRSSSSCQEPSTMLCRSRSRPTPRLLTLRFGQQSTRRMQDKALPTSKHGRLQQPEGRPELPDREGPADEP